MLLQDVIVGNNINISKVDVVVLSAWSSCLSEELIEMSVHVSPPARHRFATWLTLFFSRNISLTNSESRPICLPLQGLIGCEETALTVQHCY